MEVQSKRLDHLTTRLRAERRVWVRVAANRPRDYWQLSVLEVTLGEPPPMWTRQSWLYERASFIAVVPAGATVARWLEHRRVRANTLSLPISIQESVQVERRPSRFAGIYETLPWPSLEWKVPVAARQDAQMLHTALVADDAPAFLSYDLAAAAFFGIDPSPGGRSFSGSECVIREQDRRARIESVRVRPTDVIVTVSGEHIGGASLILGGFDGQRKRLRNATSEVRLPIASGIPPGSWLALHRGRELLDRRGLDPAWGGHTDVAIEVDPTTEVEVLISGGEGVATEFKRELPPDDRILIAKVMKTVAAFANTSGGTILFGVDDDGTIRGLGVNNTRTAIDRVTSLVSDWVKPLVDFELHVADVNDRQVLLVRIQRGSEPPYGVATTERRIDYYVRRGGTSLLATPADIRAIVRTRLSP